MKSPEAIDAIGNDVGAQHQESDEKHLLEQSLGQLLTNFPAKDHADGGWDQSSGRQSPEVECEKVVSPQCQTKGQRGGREKQSHCLNGHVS